MMHHQQFLMQFSELTSQLFCAPLFLDILWYWKTPECIDKSNSRTIDAIDPIKQSTQSRRRKRIVRPPLPTFENIIIFWRVVEPIRERGRMEAFFPGPTLATGPGRGVRFASGPFPFSRGRGIRKTHTFLLDYKCLINCSSDSDSLPDCQANGE